MLTLFPFAHGDINYLEWGSFIAGITHPVLGPDHLLAMVSVGVVSAQLGGNAIWSVPATFVGVMVVGGFIGLAGFPLPWLEMGIALSVLLLGLIIAADLSLPIVAAMGTVGLFAIFHGVAHGAEMPAMAWPIAYVQGFLTGTAVIHIGGLLIGHSAQRIPKGRVILRLAGIVIAFCGLYFMVR